MNKLEWMEFTQCQPLPLAAHDHKALWKKQKLKFLCCECVCPATSFLQQEQCLINLNHVWNKK